jgi:murein DD-endopeptidase MepM/ murein hydrolase activator NlpD
MRGGAAPGAPAPGWSLEVQIHPSDIRKRVRYLFLSRLQVTILCIAALLYALFVTLAVAVAPGVIGGMLNRQEYFALAAERGSQGERLKALVRQLEHVQARGQRLGLNLGNILLVYALPSTRAPQAGLAQIAQAEVSAALPDSIYAGAIQQGDRLRARIGEELRQADASLARLQDFERDSPERVRATPSVCPLRGGIVLTSSFRNRRSPFTKELEFHPGLDIAAPAGTPIHATADGVVAFAGQFPMGRNVTWWRYGNLVAVRNGDQFVTLYGHCDQIRVRAGQRVARGDVIATVGNTGWSTSPHVHYEVRKRDAAGEPQPVDPLLYILDRHWQNEERLLFGGRNTPPRGYEPLPAGLGR